MGPEDPGKLHLALCEDQTSIQCLVFGDFSKVPMNSTCISSRSVTKSGQEKWPPLSLSASTHTPSFLTVTQGPASPLRAGTTSVFPAPGPGPRKSGILQMFVDLNYPSVFQLISYTNRCPPRTLVTHVPYLKPLGQGQWFLVLQVVAQLWFLDYPKRYHTSLKHIFETELILTLLKFILSSIFLKKLKSN